MQIQAERSDEASKRENLTAAASSCCTYTIWRWQRLLTSLVFYFNITSKTKALWIQQMAEKRTVVVQLNEAEWDALEDLAKKKDLSKVAVMRQALRLYQLVDVRLSEGEKLVFESKESKRELLVL
jgi:hypothetical protein